MSINSIQNIKHTPINYNSAYSTLIQAPNQQQVMKTPIVCNETNIYPLIKDDKNFQELSNSKFFKGDNLTYKMTRLKNDREMKIATNYDPYKMPSLPYGALIGLYMPQRIDYKKYDIPDYLRLLNDFVKSDKISDDLKQYYLQDKSNNLEIYYTKLDKIPAAKTKEEAVGILISVN